MPSTAAPRLAGRADWWLKPGRSERWLWVDRAGLAAGALVLWQVLVTTAVLNDRFIPAPSSVVTAMWDLVQIEDVRSAFLQACGMVLVASAIAGVVGIVLGAAIGLSDLLYRAFHPVVMMLFSTPKLIFLPLFILVLGVQFSAKVAYGAVSGVFPLLVTVIAGVRAVDPKLLNASKSMGASRLQSIVHVSVPAAVPSVFVGLWYCVKHALLGVLIVELFVSQRGVGYFVRTYTSTFQVDRVFGLIVALSLFAIVLSQLILRLERRVSRWRELEVQ